MPVFVWLFFAGVSNIMFASVKRGKLSRIFTFAQIGIAAATV